MRGLASRWNWAFSSSPSFLAVGVLRPGVACDVQENWILTRDAFFISWFGSGYICIRQSTQEFGTFSHIFLCESGPRFLRCSVVLLVFRPRAQAALVSCSEQQFIPRHRGLWSLVSTASGRITNFAFAEDLAFAPRGATLARASRQIAHCVSLMAAGFTCVATDSEQTPMPTFRQHPVSIAIEAAHPRVLVRCARRYVRKEARPWRPCR